MSLSSLTALEAQGRLPSAVAPRGFLVLAEDDSAAIHAVTLATRLRVQGARAVLESEIGMDEAVARAEAAGLPRVVVVSGPDGYIVHDLIAGDEAVHTLADLERMARDDA